MKVERPVIRPARFELRLGLAERNRLLTLSRGKGVSAADFLRMLLADAWRIAGEPRSKTLAEVFAGEAEQSEVVGAHEGAQASTAVGHGKCCERDYDGDGNCDRHPVRRRK